MAKRAAKRKGVATTSARASKASAKRSVAGKTSPTRKASAKKAAKTSTKRPAKNAASRSSAKKRAAKPAAKKNPTTRKKAAGKPRPRRKLATRKGAASAKHGARADFGRAADGYFRSIEPAEVKRLAGELRKIVREGAPRAIELLKWGIPCYIRNGKGVCAIRAHGAHVTLQFWEAGIDLPDPGGLLEGTGKRLRHVKIRERGDLRRDHLLALVRAAARWNDEHG